MGSHASPADLGVTSRPRARLTPEQGETPCHPDRRALQARRSAGARAAPRLAAGIRLKRSCPRFESGSRHFRRALQVAGFFCFLGSLRWARAIAVSASPDRRWHTLGRGRENLVPLADRSGVPESRPGEFER